MAPWLAGHFVPRNYVWTVSASFPSPLSINRMLSISPTRSIYIKQYPISLTMENVFDRFCFSLSLSLKHNLGNTVICKQLFDQPTIYYWKKNALHHMWTRMVIEITTIRAFITKLLPSNSMSSRRPKTAVAFCRQSTVTVCWRENCFTSHRTESEWGVINVQ